jgi:hypothetical protein
VIVYGRDPLADHARAARRRSLELRGARMEESWRPADEFMSASGNVRRRAVASVLKERGFRPEAAVQPGAL